MAINHPDALPPHYEQAPANYSSRQAPLGEIGNVKPENQRIRPAILHEQTKIGNVVRTYTNVSCPSADCGSVRSDGYQGSLIRRQTFAPEIADKKAEEGALHQDQSSREPETNPGFIDTVSAFVAQKLEEKGRLQTVDPSDIRRLVRGALSRDLNGFNHGGVYAPSVVRGEVKRSLQGQKELRRVLRSSTRKSVLAQKQSGLEVDVSAIDMADLEEDRVAFEQEAAARYPQVEQDQSGEQDPTALWTEEEIALLGEEAATRKEPEPLDPSLAWVGDRNLAKKTAEYMGDIDYVEEEARANNSHVSTSPTWEA